jgi:hypothetical protein
VQTLDPRGQITLQQRDQSLTIIRIGRGDHNHHNEPHDIDQNMPLASFDFLLPVKADILSLESSS